MGLSWGQEPGPGDTCPRHSLGDGGGSACSAPAWFQSPVRKAALRALTWQPSEVSFPDSPVVSCWPPRLAVHSKSQSGCRREPLLCGSALGKPANVGSKAWVGVIKGSTGGY